MFSFPLDIFPEVELVDHMVVLSFFFFGGFSILFSIVTVAVSNVYFLNSRLSLSLPLSLTHTYIHTQRAMSESL